MVAAEGGKLRQTLQKAEELEKEFRQYAGQAQNRDIREMFMSMANQMGDIIPKLKGRVEHMGGVEF